MPVDYLAQVPRLLLEEFRAGRWLPIVGAGLSANAETLAGKHPPLWEQLGSRVATYLPDGFDVNGPVDALSSFEQAFGRPALIDRVRDELLIDEAVPGRANIAFSRIPFDIVITTNIDFLIEQSWRAIRWPHDVVVGEQRLTSRRRNNSTQLVKFHGDVTYPSDLVLTESDYDGFTSGFPILTTYVSSLLISRVPVLIGYSLEDPDFRAILNSISSRLGANGPTPWVLLPRATESELARYQRRGIRTVLLDRRPTANRGRVLSRLFEQLSELMEKEAARKVESSDDLLLSELRFDSSDASQVVLFIGRNEFLASHRETIFENIRGLGLAPVTAEEIRSAPGLALASRAALVRRSATVVFDIRGISSWEYELGFVSSLIPSSRIVIIADQTAGAALPSDLVGVRVIRMVRDADHNLAMEASIVGAVQQVMSDHKTPDAITEIRHRFDQGDYTYAFLQAIILIESNLRRGRSRQSSSFPQLLREELTLSAQDTSLMQEAYRIRSEYLHRGVEPDHMIVANMMQSLLRIAATSNQHNT